MKIDSVMTMKPAILLVAAAIVFCSATIGATARAQNPSQAYGSITGRVISDDGPVPFAAVTVSAAGGRDRANALRNLTTDADGNFKAEGLRQAAYIVMASSPGYVPESASLPPANDSETRPDVPAQSYYRIGDSVTIRLVKGGVITGRVLNQMGDPLIGIRVSAQPVLSAPSQRPFAQAGSGEAQTDDRGIYRIYGLGAGNYVVLANPAPGGGPFGGQFPGRQLSPYTGNAPVYHPSGSRGMAAEVTVNCGIETSGIDIQYRPIKGFSISGTIAGADPLFAFVTLTDKPSGQVINNAFVNPRGGPGGRQGSQSDQAAFAILGVADGEYELSVQGGSPEESFSATPVKIAVSGADVSGIVLTLKPMAAVRARVQIEPPVKCNAPRPATLDEQVFTLRPVSQISLPNLPTSVPSPSGDISFRNLSAGRYQLGALMLDDRYFIRSVAVPIKSTGRNTTATQKNPPAMFELSRNGITLKAGEKVNDVIVVISEGAASIDGRVLKTGNPQATDKWLVYLVPAERELADEVLRYAETVSVPGGEFKFRNLAPGKYLILALPLENGAPNGKTLSTALDPAARLRLRRAAETANQPIELQPCGRVANIQVVGR